MTDLPLVALGPEVSPDALVMEAHAWAADMRRRSGISATIHTHYYRWNPNAIMIEATLGDLEHDVHASAVELARIGAVVSHRPEAGGELKAVHFRGVTDFGLEVLGCCDPKQWAEIEESLRAIRATAASLSAPAITSGAKS